MMLMPSPIEANLASRVRAVMSTVRVEIMYRLRIAERSTKVDDREGRKQTDWVRIFQHS